MVYENYDEREHGLDRSAELYDEGVYDSTNFGERLEDSTTEDPTTEGLAADDTIASDHLAGHPTNGVEEGFGETITNNPHLEDQLEDRRLNQEAESDYKEPETPKDESLIDKAKDKINEITGKDRGVG